MNTFDIEVISDPLGLTSARPLAWSDSRIVSSGSYDSHIVKPALLFGDTVNLVSSRRTVQDYIMMRAYRPSRMPLRRLWYFAVASAYRDEYAFLGVDENLLAEESEAARLIEVWQLPSLDEFKAEIADFESKHDNGIDALNSELVAWWRGHFEALESHELTVAEKRGILTVQGWTESPPPHELIFVSDDEFFEDTFSGIRARLSSPQRVALLDSTITAVRRKGRTRKAASGAQPAIVANIVLGRLVGLEDLPIIEIVDLRDELKDSLPYFRGEMVRLSEELSDVGASDLAQELERRWHRDLAPAVEDIRRAVAAARYPRRLIDSLLNDPKSMAAGAGAIALAAGGLVAGLAALLPAVATAAYPFLRAKAAADAAMEQARQNKLFLLYAVQDRLQGQ